MNKLVSILLPTRKRVAMLEDSLTSLLGKAGRPDQLELCIVYDDDDTESAEYFNSSDWQNFYCGYGCSVTVHCVPRWGYRDLHLYINYLAKHSTGKWLFFWSDDALMETPNWDAAIKANEDYVGLLHIAASNAPMRCSILPLFHSEWVKLFGCVSPINHVDSWISDISMAAGARRPIPVTVFHDRFEDSGRNQDETWNDKTAARDSNRDYNKPQYRIMRTQWARQLSVYRAAK